MKQLFRFFFLFGYTLFIFIYSELNAAPLKFMPIQLKQPDGTVLNVYASGDEFYNWVHDKDNYTILPDPQTGFYVYAEVSNGKLVPTKYIVGKNDPKIAGLKIAANVFPKLSTENGIEPIMLSQQNSTSLFPIPNTPVVGSRYNLVIFIRFNGEQELTDPLSKYDNVFNNPAGPSVNHFYKETSNNQLNVYSYIFPQSSSIISYQDINNRNYYKKYDANTNPTGYQNDRGTRESTLLKRALEFVKTQIPGDTNLDGNNDSFIDNVVFIVSGSSEGWSDLLWPHMSTYPYSNQTYNVVINGKQISKYNFQLQSWIDNSVLDHEMGHSLGLPDLYRYNVKDIDPIGPWDLMNSNSMHMNNYMKWKYLGWINSLPEIKQSGTYWLKKSTSTTKNIYVIKSPRSAQDFFILEYRSKEGLYEKNIPGSGLLVYRINNRTVGNASGPPDEIYVYRPNGTLNINGIISQAYFSSAVGRTQISDLTNPSSFLADGLPGGLSIKNISAASDSIKFDVEIVQSVVENNDYTVQSTNFNWMDISQSGTKITNWMNATQTGSSVLDDGYSSSSIPLGFEFTYFNQKFNSMYVGINGLVSFTHQFLNYYSSNPVASATQYGYFYKYLYWPGNPYFANSIAAAYADYELSKTGGGGGQILYKTIGDKFILSWLNIGKNGVSNDTTNSFQIILDRSDNSVTINHKNFGLETTRNELKIGIQKDQGCGVGWLDSGDYTERIPTNISAVVFRPRSQYKISTVSSPPVGGVTTGDGIYNSGQTNSVTVSAVPNSGYRFYNWSENGVAVSSNASYSFPASASRTLVANFSLLPILYLSPTYKTVTSLAGGTSFFIGNSATGTSPMNWTAVSNASWVTITSATSGSSSTTMNLSYQTNTGSARVGQITITSPETTGSPAVFEVRQSGTSDAEIFENEIPSTIVLNQNYPNPFNPSTVIKYGLPKESEVRITVHDLLGRELAVLVNETQRPGYHTITFNINSRILTSASGIYFYKITAGNFTDTKKMILLK